MQCRDSAAHQCGELQLELKLSWCYLFHLQILLELYTRVRKQERNFKRAFILGGLYGLVECTAPRVLLAVARVVLAVSHIVGSFFLMQPIFLSSYA